MTNRNGSNNGERKEYWVIVDNYVLDLTNFLQYHPAGAQKTIQRVEKNQLINII